MATSISVNPDVAALKKAFAEVRNEAKLTSATIRSGMDTGEAVAKLNKLQAAAASLKQALEKVGDKTRIDIDVKDADAALGKLHQKVAKLAGEGGKGLNTGAGGGSGQSSQATRDEQRLHALRKSHAQIEASLKRKFSEQQARDAERAFSNYQRVNPHLRQFSTLGDFLSRGKGQYGGDFERVRRETMDYVRRRSGIGGGGSGVPMRRAGRLAGALGGMAGGALAGGLGGGGTFGSLGSMAGSGMGAAVGMIGGPLGMIAGALVGGLASSAFGGLGRILDQAMNDAITEGMKGANLTRAFGGLTSGFNEVRDAARDAAQGMDVSYVDSAGYAASYAQKAALRTPDGLGEGLRDAYGFGRGLGVGQGAGVSFMATLRGTGAAGDEKAAKRIGLSVVEAIQKGGLGPQANQVLSALENFATSSTQANFRAPDVAGFAQMMATGTSLNLPGLNAGNMGGLLQTADASMRRGGNAGMASQIVSLDTIAQLDPRLSATEAHRVMEGGWGGTIGSAFGKDSIVVREAQKRLEAAQKSGDTQAASAAQADLTRFADLASGPNANVRIGPEKIKNIVRNSASTSEADLSIARDNNISTDQASALRIMAMQPGGFDDVEKRLKAANIDIDKLNPAAYMEQAFISGAGRPDMDKMAQNLLDGKDHKALDDKQKGRLEAVKGGSDENLRDVLLKILNEVGAPQSAAERAQQAQTDIRNAAVRVADQLIPLTADMKDGILALVEKLAPQSEYAKREQQRRDLTGRGFKPEVIAKIADYNTQVNAALAAGNKSEAKRIARERDAYGKAHDPKLHPEERASSTSGEAASAPTSAASAASADPGQANAPATASAASGEAASASHGPLLSQIAKGEGTSDEAARARGFASGYDVPLGYGKFGMPDKPLSSMTLGEVKQYQTKLLKNSGGLNSSAVGKYQIVGKTLRGLQAGMGLSDDAVFSPELQDKMAIKLAERRGLGQYRAGKLSGKDFQARMANEWASIADPHTDRALQHTGTNTDQFQSSLAGLNAPIPETQTAASGMNSINMAGNLHIVVTDEKGQPVNNVNVASNRVEFKGTPSGAFS